MSLAVAGGTSGNGTAPGPLLAGPRAQAVLYESEAALRLVDQELQRLCDAEAITLDTDPAATFDALQERLDRALERLRDGRAALLQGIAACGEPRGALHASALVAQAATLLQDVERSLLAVQSLVERPDSGTVHGGPVA